MDQLRKNMADILGIDLALENYHDDTGIDYSEEEIGIIDDLEILRAARRNKTLEEQELIALSEDILHRLNKILDNIGKDNFIFYESGNVEYIWKYLNIKKENKNE